MGRHACVIILLAVCALWSIGEALSCDQCGRECVNSCGTRQFRACCFNNLKKRVPDLGFKLWMAPPRYTGHLHLIYDA
ncbi:trissin [Cephus cinctus]|uniref:Trissin n=1 Tax=Cephus cinctus TaxID=211228 RepID=A0AAJ7BWG1_CEPCN|nr:trissin [Cephus cinctus]XP_015596073.1 trissin [Cephus cinctus]